MSINKRNNKFLTIMLIPHRNSNPFSINLSTKFIYSLILFFVGLIIWASFIISRQIDYWAKSAENLILEKKTEQYAKEILQSRKMLEEVKDIEKELKKLLNYKSREAIIEGKQEGGPSLDDIKELNKYLQDKISITHEEFFKQMKILKSESSSIKEKFTNLTLYITEEREKFRATPNTIPCEGRITSHYGFRIYPFTGKREFHPAIDIACDKGTPVRATADGVVTFSDWCFGYGRLVIIDHGFGFSTRYAHNSKNLSKKGTFVRRAEIIALSGSSGTTTGPHLHYEVHFGGNPINPLKYVKKAIRRSNVLAYKEERTSN